MDHYLSCFFRIVVMRDKFAGLKCFSISWYGFYKRHCGPGILMGWRLLCKTVNCAKNSVLFLKGGQAVATKLECQVAMLAARQVQIHFISVFFDGERTSKSYMQEISFVCFLHVQMLRSLKLRVSNWPWPMFRRV